MEVREISKNDIADVVNVHNSAFQGFFLTELGNNFLNHYYKSISVSEDGILLGCFDGKKLIGFCAACRKSAGFNSSLIRENLLGFSAIGIKLIFKKPQSLLRLIKNLTKTGKHDDKGEYAELMSIGVDKSIQNTGAGKLLLAELESILKRDGISRLSLTTDVEENDNTLAFYSKRGFKQMYMFVTYPNRKMYRLIKDLI